MIVAYDPVAIGLVKSLARPGGNITGVANLSVTLNAKRLELLQECFPGIARIGVLANTSAVEFKNSMKVTEDAAKVRGLELGLYGIASRDQIEAAMASLAASGLKAMMVLPSTMLYAESRRIADLAEKHRLATVAADREFVDGGGLMSYGASLAGMYAHAADYVAKMLKGANPGDVPIEQPTVYELVVNVKTARALGLTIPQSILARADEAIE
jgi:putative ABC transport system substrate-binding protein